MARTNPVDPPAQGEEQQPMKPSNGAIVTMDGYGADPWAVVSTQADAKVPFPAPEAALVEQQDEQEDVIALPTPIAQGVWKVIAPDGREELRYEPIPGFEHLLKGQGLPHAAHSLSYHQPAGSRAQSQHAPKQKTLKRRRSAARRPSRYQSQVLYEDEDDDDDDDARASNETVYTFYIGNFDQLGKFFRRRLEELTMKPLRPIVTAWIKQLEPRRLGSYGPYHKKMPSQRPRECTPEWWPQDVRYEEPSHLDKSGLLKVAVTMMFQHRTIDEPKRKGSSWVAKLQQTAQYAIETTPPEQFSSSKGTGFSERMRDRALNEIMPSLFSVAQLYEDHLAQYNLYEGTGNVDNQQGTMCTWQPVSRPPRQSTLNRKRVKIQSRASRARAASDYTVSGDETEVDDTAADAYLRRERHHSQKQRIAKATNPLQPASTTVPVPEPVPTSSATLMTTYVAAPPLQGAGMMISPTASFDQTMTRLRLDEEPDMDVKCVNPTQFNDPSLMCNMYGLGQPLQYSASQSNFNNPGFHGQENVVPFNSPVQSSFMSGSPYNPSYTMFNTPYPTQLHIPGFAAPSLGANQYGFPYDYAGGFSMVTEDMNTGRSYNGLPLDLEPKTHYSPRH